MFTFFLILDNMAPPLDFFPDLGVHIEMTLSQQKQIQREMPVSEPEARQTPEARTEPELPGSIFAARVAENPDKKVIIDDNRSLTYLQAYEKSTALAKHLYILGLKPGDHAAVMTYNELEHSIIRTAFMLIRVGMIMIGYRSRPPEIGYIVGNSDSNEIPRTPTGKILKRELRERLWT